MATFVSVPLSKFPAEARQYLSEFDRDGDGTIDVGELKMAAEMVANAKAGSLAVDMFPARLHETIRGLDEQGDGVLDIHEITEMVESYAALKEANKTGEISIKMLPREIQPTLKVFDVDGDGTVAPMELARGAELYLESQKTVKKLTYLAVALVILLGGMLACIAGMTIAVVEGAKESSVGASGVTTVKGTGTPVATASVSVRSSLWDLAAASPTSLMNIKQLGPIAHGDEIYAFTVSGFQQMEEAVNFFTSSGKTLSLSTTELIVTNADGTTMFSAHKDDIGRKMVWSSDYDDFMDGAMGDPDFSMDFDTDSWSK
jgi:Ca2+-binding EF-hand superfamily protein